MDKEYLIHQRPLQALLFFSLPKGFSVQIDLANVGFAQQKRVRFEGRTL